MILKSTGRIAPTTLPGSRGRVLHCEIRYIFRRREKARRFDVLESDGRL